MREGSGRGRSAIGGPAGMDARSRAGADVGGGAARRGRARIAWRLGTAACGGLAVLALFSAPLSAQHPDWRADDRLRERPRGEPRFFFGIEGLAADPVGEFGRFVDDGWGLGLNARALLDPQGIVGLRLGAGFVHYGGERQHLCFERPFGCRIETDLVTSNDIAFVDFGPEVGLPLGVVRPYVGVSGGISYFATTSRLDDYDPYYGDHGLFETTNFDDLVWAWRGRAGLQTRLSRRVSLDFSAVYHENGEAEYLREGDIRDNPDGSITVFPVLSEANLVTYQIGVSIGLGGDDDGDRRRPRKRPRW